MAWNGSGSSGEQNAATRSSASRPDGSGPRVSVIVAVAMTAPPLPSDPHEVERRAQVLDLRPPDVLGVHRLDQVGAGQVDPPEVVGLRQGLLEAVEVQAGEPGLGPEPVPDVRDEDLAIAVAPGRAIAGRGPDSLGHRRGI